MLRPWMLLVLVVVECCQGQDYLNTAPRKRRENDKDITTVLLVDNHGKNSLGRFISVKPDLGLITSTARTFIQDGVTTEYATQVLGTTLDNGRLYAHLLTKSSRVVYDHDAPTKAHGQKKWNFDENQIYNKKFVGNTDYIIPDSPQYVFPTQSSDEILNEAQSNNRVIVKADNIDMTHENLIIHNDNPQGFNPSKVKEWDNLPTFTVRNEFSPSGFSFLGGDLPEFDSKTEKSKFTTPQDRKARLLFKAGLIKPNSKDLETVTYTGFADFTTTVANTVIVFTPHTTEPNNKIVAPVTKISVEPTIQPTLVLDTPVPSVVEKITTEKQYPTFVTTEEPATTQPLPEEIETSGPNKMEIGKEDRDGKIRTPDEPVDFQAKLSVLANEQKDGQIVKFTEDVIQPSETQPIMLSTPSDEDIAKILASLQAQAQATQPLDLKPSILEETTPSIRTTGGATTIFFEDDDFSFEPTTSQVDNKPSVSTENVQVLTTTESDEQEETTTQQVTTTDAEAETEPEPICTDGIKVVPTTTYKTLTYLTTFYIPVEDRTSTSIRSNVVVSTQVLQDTVNCNVEPSSVLDTTTTEPSIATEPIPTTTEAVTEPQEEETTTMTQEITTVTEFDPETTESATEEGDEVELIFKTLYTTYTYLTTYFQDSTSSVASRIVVTTNVITSTLDPANDATDVAGLLNENEDIVPSRTVTFDDLADIQPTITANSIDEIETSATPALDDKPVKTFYTTYTYFTTIFVDGETEISSRTEVYTNYVTPTAVDETIQPTKLPNEDDEVLSQNRLRKLKFDDDSKYSSINRAKPSDDDDDDDNDVIPTTTQGSSYVTLTRGEIKKIEDNDVVDLSDYETISTMVTDVRSSTSKGEERIIDSIDKRNGLLDDQIVSESNNESEILPSPPTLLLQTSFTTFTYFTTQYHGTTSSDVVSRLETITNVVTSTLTPTQRLSTEDASLPVTYFTTFTYWTTLYKDGQTKVTSREETVSNVVTPEFKPTEAPEAVIPLITSTVNTLDVITPTATLDNTVSKTEVPVPYSVGDDELTTFYTTYTYYTTSYVGDETVLNSRLETVTNVLNKSQDIDDNAIGRALNYNPPNLIEDGNKVKPSKPEVKPTGLLSTVVNTVDHNGTATVISTDVYGTYIDGLYAKVLESTSSVLTQNITPSSAEVEKLKPTGVVSINQGKIVDADGVSTLFYTTQAVGTYIDNLYAQVIESTSSLSVDLEKKANLGTDVPVAHRTGLVRLIEGNIVQNRTTTLYESKVLGTIIDGRYAQIIESTSSFILPSITHSTAINEIVPTPTKSLGDISATAISPSPVVLEGSITDTPEEESSTESIEDDDDPRKSRLSFQSKKRTFTPAIRPFASRQRPTFAPKRSKTGVSTAATITRSDFTPTVTAVPASKPNRFGGRRSSSSNPAVQPSASSGRRFSRPSSSKRNSANQIKPTSTGFRRASSRSSLASIRPSSSFGGNSRFKIRPTSSGLSRSSSSKIVTETPPDGDNELTTNVTDEPESGEDGDTTIPLNTTTESSRRTNPLLRLRRPPISRAPVTRTTAKPASKSSAKSNLRGGTTTVKPRTTTSRPNALANRPRSGGLFPRRNLFTTTTTPAPEEDDEEDLEEETEESDEDTDYESSQQHTQTETAPTSPSPKGVQIRPFKRRVRRQTYSRFRRPTGRSTAAPTPESIDYYEEPTTKASVLRSRYQSNKYRSGKEATTTTTTPASRRRITPSRTSTRSQFTLREKDSSNLRSTNFKSRSSSIRRTTTAAPRNNRRNGYVTESPVRRTTASSRGRASRGRVSTIRRGYEEDNNIYSKFDGTITVTYQIPTEATIPVVNGKVTEYKNIVTAKISTEVLGPNQYSTSVNPFGKEVKVLIVENTSVHNNGATLLTQYVLNESPTTSVEFTPTQIRGRKTSFSHIIPSTAYQVVEVVNTIQPAIAAQAPLANILLSQLLLGGGVQANPLLAPQFGAPGIPASPTTELKTRSTTYVTTVVSTQETVIPLTFRGKEILTTISEITSNVVTATEYFTDTLTVTPTLPAFGQAPQFNTLLLPLLQQQLQQQQANQLLQSPALFPQPIQQQPQQIESEEDEYSNFADTEQVVSIAEEPEVTEAPKRKNKKNKKKPAKVDPIKQSTVITLYISGSTPGEFTTLLSTVAVDEASRKRRETVEPSKVYDDLPVSTLDYYDKYVQPAIKDIGVGSEIRETESLESIIGDVTKHLKTDYTKPSKSTKKYTINLSDLSNNHAPVDAKVETFTPRGSSVTVSRLIGKIVKRDLDSISRSDSINHKRRIVKKLIRKQPVTTTKPTVRKRRRKVKIKKKKRLLTTTQETPNSYLNGLERDGPEATKPRRKVIITRKRVLPKEVMTATPSFDPIPTTQLLDVDMEKSEIAKHFRQSMEESRMGKKLKFADVADKTEENFVEDEDVDSDDNQEYDDDIDEEDDEEEFDESDYNEDDESDDGDDETNENYETDDESNQSDTKIDEADHNKAADEENDTTDNPYSTDKKNEADASDQPQESEEITTDSPTPYQPFFPELSESTDVPVLLLKTTVVSNVELETKTVTTTRLRTYTFVVTRVAGNEEIVTSTTEVRPQIKTTLVTDSSTLYTTLTLLDLDNVDNTDVPTFLPTLDYNPSLSNVEDPDMREEGRNLATRVMSNGVEVIVAGDKTTFPGDKDFKKTPASQKHVTLKPSTLTDHMSLVLPDATLETTPLDPNQFIVKTCLTTFTYLTTYLENGFTTVSSHEQVVSNVATQERISTGKILPTPAMGITLTQYPTLSVGVFHTTYTYLNTILDGEQPLVISSQHVVANTVTALDDRVPPEEKVPVKDTNTYFSTINLEKTLYEGGQESVISTREVVTQVVITESIPPKDRPVMTSYIAMDRPSVNDVVKTHFVTYTYYNTLIKDGKPVVYKNVSTESELFTEKVLVKSSVEAKPEKFDILATKVYYTTFTYFTTLMKDNDSDAGTIVNSHTNVVENVVTETLKPNLFSPNYLASLSQELKSANLIEKLATLLDGQQVQITVTLNRQYNEIRPTKVQPIEKTDSPSLNQKGDPDKLEGSFTSKPNIITGSTIVFVDDDPFANLSPTPTLVVGKPESKINKLFASEVVKQTKVDVVTSKVKRIGNKNKSKVKLSPTKALSSPEKTKTKKTPTSKPADLLGLGSININTLQALTPMLSAMAGYINQNLKTNRRNDANTSITEDPPQPLPAVDVQNRSPVYIPVAGVEDDFEIAESQNIASFDWTDKEAPLLGHNGIPISPGDIINANSDVIVGKPGRVAPRLPPAIPLHGVNEVPIGMVPPPRPDWSKKEIQDQVPAQSNNIIHAPNKDDYVGPPPPRVKEIRDKRKHIPLELSRPQYAGEQPPPPEMSHTFNNQRPIAPSVSIVLPEVIERSTGQPLLVHLQPSQVAYVNIPFNRTTALIYGGSTETHHNGQYFDDPSPYPDQVFNPIRGTPQLNQVNQKQVSGVITVGGPVRIDSDTSANEQMSLKISPGQGDGEISVKLPPLSFGMTEQHGDVNGHVINHHVVQPLAVADEPPVNNPNYPPPPKRNLLRPRPRPTRPKGISEYMTPPAPDRISQFLKRPSTRLPIPLVSEQKLVVNTPRPLQNLQPNSDEVFPSTFESNRYQSTPVNLNTYHRDNIRKNTKIDIDDILNEDGEVVQESNARPEVLIRPTEPLIRFPDSRNGTQIRFPYKRYPRPDYILPQSKPFDHKQLRPHLPLRPGNTPSQFVKYYPTSPTIESHVTESQTEENSLTDGKQSTELEHHTTATFSTSTSRPTKPVLIFLDQHSKHEFVSRPKVTSLPIDQTSSTTSTAKSTMPVESDSSQTEKPFDESKYPARQPTNEIVVFEASTTTEKSPITIPPVLLNSGEGFANLSQQINNMEVLQPPPLVDEPKNAIVPEPSEEMKPPAPEKPTTEVVLGMNPPPLHTTTLVVPRETTSRRPRPRRPGHRRTTSTTPVTTSSTTTITTRQGYFKTRQSITPTPTIKITPPMEVIVGQPLTDQLNEVEDIPSSTPPLIVSLPQEEEVVTKPIHHSGNEIKIVDHETPSSVMESRKTVLPTRYITHTKTHTVTITKTTVVKTLGGPPSTLTLLVTKTEKSYIVDTVTEFHTLVKPTSIVETVTTTVHPSIAVKPITVNPNPQPSIIIPDNDDDDDSLEDFIIKDSGVITNEEPFDSGESIFVVMTDKNKGTIIKVPPQSTPPTEEHPHRDEITDNEVNNVLLGGILIANPPLVKEPLDEKNKDKCSPECNPSRNELCQKVEGSMRCVCRPGFARMFPDRPCNPTYTYSMNITVEKVGRAAATYSEKLSKDNSTEFITLARKVHEALDRMVMQSDLRDIYHGIHVRSFHPPTSAKGLLSNFYLQLSDNIDETRMEDIFRKYLRNTNFSIGGTEVLASSQTVNSLKAHDFNECENPKFHDCSENAQCFNLRGTYTCSCKEGFSDLSENLQYPGRVCSADQVGCEKCSYHGTCYSRGEDVVCECFHWYAGDKCEVNMKVLLIALATIGTVLFALLLVCIILTCIRKKPRKTTGVGFLPINTTQDRRAMIEDTSSEDSRSEASVPPYVQKTSKLKPPPAKGALKKVSMVEHAEPSIIFPDQKDRSLTVMIPRAKYHPAPPTSPLTNYTTFDARKPSVPSVVPEAKLLSYLDAGPSPNRTEQNKRKFSNQVSEPYIEEKPSSRKTSGALVSAGFEVSATVVNSMGTLGTICGTEADRSENATLIQKISADLMSRADSNSQFNTLNKSLISDDDLESTSNWLDIPRISTMSESRSFDETTIPPPMKSFTRSEYDLKSLHQTDEGHTMAERDLGSTFLLPHTHLYKPDRGSDISGFESL